MKDRIGTIPIQNSTVSDKKGYYITINQTYIAIIPVSDTFTDTPHIPLAQLPKK